MTVLVVGDANVDIVLQGDVVPRFGQAEQLLTQADLLIGGSASIMACGVARLGVETTLAAVTGDDEFGRFMLAELTSRGVDTACIRHETGSPTGMSVILSQPHDRAILTSLGAMSSLTAQDVASAVATTGARHVHFASFFLLPSLAADLPPLFDDLRRANVVTSLDTNWDPADNWSGLEDVLPRLDILLPNRAELRAIARSVCADVDADHQAALALARLGPRVVVKSGASGGWSIDAGGRLTRVPALDVEVVDTTGAGDSFDAGYVAALASGVDDELTRLRWATTCGSLSTRRPGGTTAQATPAELHEFTQGRPPRAATGDVR